MTARGSLFYRLPWVLVPFQRCRGVAQPGRAPGSGPGGRRFKSSLPDHSFSLDFSIAYAASAASVFSTVFGTFGTTEGNSNPNPHRSAHFLRNATSSLILS